MKHTIAFCTLLLCGCAGVDSAQFVQSVDEPYVAARDFIVAGEVPEASETYPMYGIIALSDSSKGRIKRRNKWVCETFLNLPNIAVLTSGGIGSVDESRITPTYWMLKQDGVDRSNCDALRDGYDFERAKAIFSLADRPGETGPMLIAIQGNEIGVLDISKAKKKWVRAMVAKWSEAMRASDGEDITVESGPIADTCAILTGRESRRVTASVYEVVAEDVEAGASWYERLAGVVREFAVEILPFGGKVEKYANKTCDEISRTVA